MSNKDSQLIWEKYVEEAVPAGKPPAVTPTAMLKIVPTILSALAGMVEDVTVKTKLLKALKSGAKAAEAPEVAAPVGPALEDFDNTL